MRNMNTHKKYINCSHSLLNKILNFMSKKDSSGAAKRYKSPVAVRFLLNLRICAFGRSVSKRKISSSRFTKTSP